MEDSPIRQRVQLALRAALKSRDTVAVSALRSALAAVDNAGAVPAGPAPAAGAGGPHFAGAVGGLGAAEAERRRLTEPDIEEIIRAEIAERQTAVRDYDRTGHADRAGRLRREASVLLSVLDTGPPSP